MLLVRLGCGSYDRDRMNMAAKTQFKTSEALLPGF